MPSRSRSGARRWISLMSPPSSEPSANRRDAIQDQGLQPVPICGLVRERQLIHFIPLSRERYWALSVAVWTLPRRGQHIKQNWDRGQIIPLEKLWDILRSHLRTAIAAE